MKKGKKIIITVGVAILVLAAILITVLYTNGFSGIHNHTVPKDEQIKVACVGDSITYGHGISGWAKNNYPAQLQNILEDDYHVANFGHSGRTLSNNGDKPYTESEQYRLSIEYDADIIVFMLGTNDSKPENWTNADIFIAEYEKMLNDYKQNNPDVKIILCTPTAAFYPDGKSEGKTNFDIQPSIVEQIKTRIITFALLNEYECIDMYSLTYGHHEWFKKDNVHPSKEGASVIAQAVASKIKNLGD